MAKPIVIPILNTGSYSLDKQFKIEVTKVSDESGKSLLSEYKTCTVTIANNSDSKEVMDKVMRLVNMDRQIYKLGTVGLGVAPAPTTRTTRTTYTSNAMRTPTTTRIMLTATRTFRIRARGLISSQMR